VIQRWKAKKTYGIGIVTLPHSPDLPFSNSQEPKELENKHHNQNSDERDHSPDRAGLDVAQFSLRA
jgi:hypothetical protein